MNNLMDTDIDSVMWTYVCDIRNPLYVTFRAISNGNFY